MKKTNKRDRQTGAVLVVVMLVMLGLLGLGMTALWLTTGNLQVGANVSLRTNALYVAEAGIEHARAILNDRVIAPDLTMLLSAASPAVDGHSKNDIPSAIRPEGVGAVMVDLAGVPLAGVAYPPITFNRGTGVVGTPTSGTMGAYTVWIRNDRAELRQELYEVDLNQTVIIRSQGVAADGRTNVVLEATLGRNPAAAADPNNPSIPQPVLCNSGKNACDDNNSTQYGIVVN